MIDIENLKKEASLFVWDTGCTVEEIVRAYLDSIKLNIGKENSAGLEWEK